MRAAQKQASNAATTAAGMGGLEQGLGLAAQSTVSPFLTGELTEQHAFSPDQLNELLTSAGAGTGGATGSLESTANLEEARTRNAGGVTPALEEMQRERGRQMAKTSEGVATQDVGEALKARQAGAAGLAELSTADTSAALKAMGLQSQDIGQEIEAGQHGWFQNLTGMISAMSGATKGPMSYV